VSQPAFTKTLGMPDPIQDSFHDPLLSVPEGEPGSPSSGTSHNLAQECLMVNSKGVPSLLMESLEGTLADATMNVVAFAPPQLDLPSQETPLGQSRC
jgi:hypothetical protein